MHAAFMTIIDNTVFELGGAERRKSVGARAPLFGFDLWIFFMRIFYYYFSFENFFAIALLAPGDDGHHQPTALRAGSDDVI